MSDFLKKKWQFIVGCILFSMVVSYGLSDFISFFKIFCLVFPISLLGVYYFTDFQSKNEEIEKLVQSLDQIIGEQNKVIEDYEQIFDAQLVHLPCVCGGNTFEGLFSPKMENIVECEKCKNKYRVSVNYDSILISEPMDLNKSFDELVNSGN